MPFARSCTVCGRIARNGNRCPEHTMAARPRTTAYRKAAAAVVAGATTCHLCGQPFTDPDDPPVADHVVPRALGGSDDPTNLAPAHRSCNGRKGRDLGGVWAR